VDADVLEAGRLEPGLVLARGERTGDAADVAPALRTGVSSFSATTSLIPMRPLGFRTRPISASTAGLSTERLMTQFEITTSTDSAGSGICSITPLRKCAFAMPASRAFRRASSSISSVMSRPYATPVGPTRLAERITSMPPPEPRSSTVSPSRSSATAVGLPQPSDANTAASGSSPRCSAS
jgi:hypothetical protein